jgi:hypothetical protein
VVEQAIRGVRTSGEWLRAACPFCEEGGKRDRKSSLAVRKDTGYFYCLKCGIKGFLEGDEYEREDAPRDTTIPQFDQPFGFYELADDPGRCASIFADHRRYLKGRGVPRSLQRQVGIGACDDGFWAGRVIIPFKVAAYPRWLGWSARLIAPPHRDAEGAAALPYLYPKGMPRGQFLFNHDALSSETDVPLLVVEGAFDALPYWPHAAACWGKPSQLHVEALIKSRERPICVALDGDAWKQGEALAMRLRFEGVRAGFVRLPPGEDPNTVEKAWLVDEAAKSIDRVI